MFYYINGKVTIRESNYIVLENNGIGYQIYTPNPYSFRDDINTVYIYQHLREDDNTLYGFVNKEEKNLFLKLISVKGMGPKTALPILATGSVGGIIDAIERENLIYLKKFPKIGDKVAKQIILDLKGKLKGFSDIEFVDDNKDQLVEVLKGLGYKDKEVKNIIPQIDSSLNIEEQVKEALKLLLK